MQASRPSVFVSATLLKRLCSIAQARSPYEACGVVRAVRGPGGFEIRSVVLLPNVARNRIQGFRLRCEDTRTVIGPWSRHAGHLCGVFHTHTRKNAAPSARDVAMMRAVQGVHLIAASDGSCRAFLSGQRLVEAQVLS